eukprot:scaffold32088_cov62-Phaeocystis_antarctica.AAC.3
MLRRRYRYTTAAVTTGLLLVVAWAPMLPRPRSESMNTQYTKLGHAMPVRASTAAAQSPRPRRAPRPRTVPTALQ